MRIDTRLDEATLTRRAQLGASLAADLQRLRAHADERLGPERAEIVWHGSGYRLEADARRLSAAPSLARAAGADAETLEAEGRRLERYSRQTFRALERTVYDAIAAYERGGNPRAVDRVFRARLGGDWLADLEHAGEQEAAMVAYKAAQRAAEGAQSQEERTRAAEALMREGTRLGRLGLQPPG